MLPKQKKKSRVNTLDRTTYLNSQKIPEDQQFASPTKAWKRGKKTTIILKNRKKSFIEPFQVK
jgi:hypothetical protein